MGHQESLVKAVDILENTKHCAVSQNPWVPRGISALQPYSLVILFSSAFIEMPRKCMWTLIKPAIKYQTTEPEAPFGLWTWVSSCESGYNQNRHLAPSKGGCVGCDLSVRIQQALVPSMSGSCLTRLRGTDFSLLSSIRLLCESTQERHLCDWASWKVPRVESSPQCWGVLGVWDWEEVGLSKPKHSAGPEGVLGPRLDFSMLLKVSDAASTHGVSPQEGTASRAVPECYNKPWIIWLVFLWL